MKRILIVNAYGHSNRGDSVLLDECIDEVITAFPASEVAVALFEGTTSRAVSLRRIGNPRLSGNKVRKIETIFLLITARLPSIFWNLLPVEQRETMKFMKNADLVISAPGGYITDVNASWIVALVHIERGLSLAKHVVLAPQSIGPLKSSMGRKAIGKVLSRCDVNCVRDSPSEQFLKTAGVPAAKILKTGDSAFWNVPSPVDATIVDSAFDKLGMEPEESFIGATAVDWSFPHKRNAMELKENYIAKFTHIVKEIRSTHGLRTVFFNQVDDDREVLKEIGMRCGEDAVIQNGSPPSPVLRAMMARSSSFIGTRFHSCIFAMMGGVPTTAIAYLPKTTGIMKDLKISRLTSIEAVDDKMILNHVEGDLARPELARQELTDKLSNYRSTQKRFSEVLASLAVEG